MRQMRTLWITPLLVALALPARAQEMVTVEVTSTPTRATVEVLGSGEVGRTPLRALRVPVGEHDFIFTRPGYGRVVMHVAVTEDGQAIAATLERAASLDVRADHLPARGGRIRVDGQSVGTVPARVEIAPGRRLVEVEAEGFITFGQWVEAAPGGSARVDVRLEPRPPDTGSILVITDVSNAEVFVDGLSRGRTPRVVEGLAPGAHRVDVVAESGARAEVTVEVRVEAREIVSVELESQPPPPGSAAITSEPLGATVLVDGEPRGVTPLELPELTPGAHMLDLSLEGFVSEQRVLTIETGARRELAVQLSRGEPRAGRIVVRASREDAFVVVDGLSRGRAPISLEHVRPGRHAVRLIAEGSAPFEAECVITYGETCTIDATLAPAPVALRVEATLDGEPFGSARLFVDGTEVGPLPWEGALAPGEHQLEARAEGLEPASRTLEVVPDAAGTRVALALTTPAAPPLVESIEEAPEPDPAEARPAPLPRLFVPRSGADALASGDGTASFFLGWPYLFGAELAVGLPGPLDVALALRTFGRLTELEVGARVGARVVDFFALGATLRLAAGLGPDQIDAFSLKLDGRVTALPVPELAVSAWIGLDLSTDGYPFAEDGRALVGNIPRQDLARARLGGALEWRFLQDWSIDLRLEGILASSAGRRRLYGDVLELGGPDTELYGELAAVHHW